MFLGHFARACKRSSPSRRPAGGKKFKSHQQNQLIDGGEVSPWLLFSIADSNEVAILVNSGADVNSLSENALIGLAGNILDGVISVDNLRWGDGNCCITAYASSDPLQIEASFSAWISAIGYSSRSISMALGVLKIGFEVSACELKPQKVEGIFPAIPDPPVHLI